MEVVSYAARANLRRLLALHPQWTQKQYAQAVGMSLGWVKKWKKRLQEAKPGEQAILHARSRARQHPPERLSQGVVDRILAMRDEPPEGLGRIPGPKALLYSLPRDAQLQGERLPRSSRTIYQILKQAGRINHRLPKLQQPGERPARMRQWQLDFKDASSVPADPDGKRQHVVEVLNAIEEGTSILIEAQVGADFHAETTLQAVAELFRRHGLPQALRLDRDGRFVSSPSGSDFPSALRRFCHCLGVAVLLCDPHHPQQNGLVERYHRTYQEECLALHRPTTLEQVREVTEHFALHSNDEQPHQGLSCDNRPPRVAFPSLPALPPVPEVVEPDRWLAGSDGLHLVRLVRRDGTVSLALQSYYLGRHLAGQYVALHLSAAKQAWLVVWSQRQSKTLPLKGLCGQALRFEAFVQLMSGEARSERRLRTAQERRARLRASTSP